MSRIEDGSQATDSAALRGRLYIALGFLGCVAIMLGVLLPTPEVASTALEGPDSASVIDARPTGGEAEGARGLLGSSRVGTREAEVGNLASSLFVRVLCSSDSEPIEGVTIRWTGSSGDEPMTGMTGAGGEFRAAVAEERAQPLERVAAHVFAPGFGSWSGELPLLPSDADSPFDIELQARGRFLVLATADGSPIQSWRLRASAVAQAAKGGARISAASKAAGEVEITGLRPGRLYDLHIKADGFRSELVTGLVPGWPDSEVIEVDLSANVGLAIVLTGNLSTEVCNQLSVSILGARGQTGRVSRPEWDSKRGTALAIPQQVSTDDEMRILVHGPLGVTLADILWIMTDGELPTIDLDLHRAQVSLVRPPSALAAEASEFLTWEGERDRGLITPRDERIDIFWTDASPETTVDLRWGALFAAGVSLPRDQPIEFSKRAEGEVRVIDVPANMGSSLSLVSRRDGRRQGLVGEQGGAQWSASLREGTYTLESAGKALGAPIVVYSDEVTVVSLDEMASTASLVVHLPAPDEEGAAFEGSQVSVMRDSLSRLTSDRAEVFSRGTREARITGLGPGPAVVKVQVPGLGEATFDVMLRAGQEVVLRPTNWESKRTLTLQFWGSDGAPLFGLRAKAWLTPRGRSAVLKLKTATNGRAELEFAGGGKLVVACEKGVWIEDLDPTQTLLELSQASGPTDELRLVFSGWWAGRADMILALTSGSGPNITFARIGDSPDVFFIDRRDSIEALAIVTHDGQRVLIGVDSTTDTVELTAAPDETRLSVSLPEGQPSPQSLRPRVTEIAGISVSGTLLAEALGSAIPFGQEITVFHTIPVTVVVDGIASHGGVSLRSEPVRILPGEQERGLALKELR